jgi:methionyl-tRNA synthetase
MRDSEHFFVRLSAFEEPLMTWMTSGALQPEIANKMQEWFGDGLRDWDISRDAPYFGFRIPGTENKYFYVWVDAPVGYIASFRELAPKGLVRLLVKPASTEVYHFIGKDIVYFTPVLAVCSWCRLPRRPPSTHTVSHGRWRQMSVTRQLHRRAPTWGISSPIHALLLRGQARPGNRRYRPQPGVRAKVNADVVGNWSTSPAAAGFIQRNFDNWQACQQTVRGIPRSP